MSRQRQIKAAVIGTGFIGPAHVEALRRLGIEVTGIAGSSPERARPKAEELHLERVYGSYREALDDPEVTVVHICTPNRYHYPISKEALAAGKHVVCEKPLAMTVQEADELVRLAAQSGLVTAVNFNIRFYPIVQEMRARVRHGDLGNVFLVQGSYLQDWLLKETDWNWRLEPEAGGGLRAVGDIGSHWLDLATFITGRHVRAVMADMATFIKVRKKPLTPIDTFAGKQLAPGDYEEKPISTEDYAAVLLRFDDGTRGVMSVSQLCAGRKNRLAIEVSGSGGALAWNGERPNELWAGHRDAPNELLIKDPSLLSPEASRWASYPGGHAEGFPDTFKQLYRAVYAAIDGDRSVEYPTFADGAEEQHIGEAIAASARDGKWTDVR
jgi:predicted dehydrogenase